MTEKLKNLLLLKESYTNLLQNLEADMMLFKDDGTYCYSNLTDIEDYIVKKSNELFLIMQKAEIEV
jgi:hypothetical protein